MAQVEHLLEKDYDEMLAVLNEAFSHNEVPGVEVEPADFEAILPIMWAREHDYPGRHLVVKEDGKIVSIVGVYPLPSVICGEELLLGTIGNVGSLPAARGKGYMKQIVTQAVEEAKEKGFAAARLGGLRSRYNRYDFDHAGMNYVCRLTQRNVKENPDFPKLHFEELILGNEKALAFARACHRQSPFYVKRETEKDFYYTLKAWRNVPYMALDEAGNYVGYFSVSPDGKEVAEWGVKEGLSAVQLLSAYLAVHKEIKCVSFLLMPYDKAQLKAAFAVCEDWHEEASSMFHVFQWDKFVGAFMKLAAETDGLMDGELKLDIQGWGKLRMSVTNGLPKAEKWDGEVEFSLTPREALNLIFGDLRAVTPLGGKRAEASWFPLPLCWNGQDRV